MWQIRLITCEQKKTWVVSFKSPEVVDVSFDKHRAFRFLDKNQAVTVATDCMRAKEIDPDKGGKDAFRLRFNGFEVIEVKT